MKLPFDKIVFNLTRLDIIASLVDEPPIPFTELRDFLRLSDGKLSHHLTVLEEHGLVSIYKGFDNKRPLTTVSLTIKGEEQLEALKQWFYECFLE